MERLPPTDNVKAVSMLARIREQIVIIDQCSTFVLQPVYVYFLVYVLLVVLL